jgi:uncharacterized protein
VSDPRPPVIDFRLRPPYKSFLDLSILDKSSLQNYTRMGVPPPPSFMESSMDLLIEEMDEANVVAGVVLGRKAAAPYGTVDNEHIAELVRDHPGRFIPFGGVDTSSPRAAVADVDRIMDEFGFAGVAVDPGWLDPPRPPDHPTLYPMYAHCAERGVPVAVTMSIFVGPDIRFSNPATIQRVAKDFPDLDLIVPHAAWPWVNEFVGVCFTAKNIWVSPDFYGHIPNMPGALHYVEAANYYLSDRMLYASAYPVRPLASSIDEFTALPFDEDVLPRALYDNACRLLGEHAPKTKERSA